jgi:flagellar protein FliS
VRYSSSANAYRENEVLAATPGRLVVITFDGALSGMARARVGIAMQSHEVTLAGLDKARDLIAELLVTLNHDKGGGIVRELRDAFAEIASTQRSAVA